MHIIELKRKKYNINYQFNHIIIFSEIIIDTWPMMYSPGPILCIVGCYLAFVLKVGPKMMEKRSPFQLNFLLLAYNMIQVIFNIWLSLKVILIKIIDLLQWFMIQCVFCLVIILLLNLINKLNEFHFLNRKIKIY